MLLVLSPQSEGAFLIPSIFDLFQIRAILGYWDTLPSSKHLVLHFLSCTFHVMQDVDAGFFMGGYFSQFF